MAGFARPTDREALAERANATAAQMRDTLDEARSHQNRNRLKAAEANTLMAIALGIDAILTRLELMSSVDE